MLVDSHSFTSIWTWDDEQLANAVADTRNAAQRDLSDLLTAAPSTTITRTVVQDAH